MADMRYRSGVCGVYHRNVSAMTLINSRLPVYENKISRQQPQ